MGSKDAAHRGKTFTHAHNAILEMEYSSSLYQQARRKAIMDTYNTLTPETRATMDVIADGFILKCRQKALQDGKTDIDRAVNLTREGAVEIIMTMFFTDDWYPLQNDHWSALQTFPR
jgi:hypothetical protein